MKAINIGGWLVAEPLTTPSLFVDCVDEFTLLQQTDGRQKLENHYKTFITKHDFAWIAEQGFELIRLPVSYAAFGDAEPYPATLEYIDAAFEYAQKYGLYILLDLHAAVGSQNGLEHSARQGAVQWHTDRRNIYSTVDTLVKFATRYATKPELWGIELLNEPSKDIPRKIMYDFYTQAYAAIRAVCSTRIIVSDAYRPIAEWEDLMMRPEHSDMLLDVHLYQVFSDKDKALSFEDHIAKTFQWQRTLEKFIPGASRVIIGEWSAALHQVYDVMEGEQRRQALQLYMQAQRSAFSSAAAHFYWTYKTEYGGEWSYRHIV